VGERRLREIQELIGRRWDLTVLVRLHERPRRYMELLHAIRAGEYSISERVLSDTLKRLCSGGLVRHECADDQWSVYALTARGQRFATKIEQMVREDIADAG
jgi:DNA-binding HxlR family transcriptional regulator